MTFYDVYLSLLYSVMAVSIGFILVRFLPYIRRRITAGTINRFFVLQYSLYVALFYVSVSLLYIRVRKLIAAGGAPNADASLDYAWGVAMLILTISVLATAIMAKRDRWAEWIPLRRFDEEEKPEPIKEKGLF